MRKLLALLAVTVTLSTAHADEISNNISSHLNEPALDALAKDLGSAMGGGSFHHGESLGFPLGVDLGAHWTMTGVNDDNPILRDDDSNIDGTIGQLEIGLPARINLIGRYGEIMDGDVVGGGLRVGIIKSVAPPIPSVSLSGLYSTMNHDFIDLETISVNLVASLDLPFIRPYIGAGYDHTKLDPTGRAFLSAAAGTPRNVKGSADSTRVEAGINLSIFPFTYITLGAGLTNGEKQYHIGAGIKI